MISKKLFPIIIFIYFFQYASERNLNHFNFWQFLIIYSKKSFYFYLTVRCVQRLYRNKVQICLLDENQYLYNTNFSYEGKKGGKTKYWRCAQRRFKCEAKCSTINDNLKNFQGEHNHGPDFDILKDFSNVGEIPCW